MTFTEFKKIVENQGLVRITQDKFEQLKDVKNWFVQTINNIIEELLGGIRVYARIRKVGVGDRKQPESTVSKLENGKIKGKTEETEVEYGPFTQVFAEENNEDIYNAMKPTFDLLKTQNVLLMSFGVVGRVKHAFFNQGG